MLAFDDQGAGDSALAALKLAIENKVQPLSVTALSQLMLRKDHSISSCARDILMKPLLLSSTGNGTQVENVKREINEWQDLIMDTYLKLKEDSSSRGGGGGDFSMNKMAKLNQKRHTSVGTTDMQQQQLMAQSAAQSSASVSLEQRSGTLMKPSAKKGGGPGATDSTNPTSLGSMGGRD